MARLREYYCTCGAKWTIEDYDLIIGSGRQKIDYGEHFAKQGEDSLKAICELLDHLHGGHIVATDYRDIQSVEKILRN